MADKAFALSPISASGVTPSQADYDAISEAFMETARGRWFLSEYARRNRNADTELVLDAVTRIERSLAAQKNPPPDGVADILAAVTTIVSIARERIEGALDGAAIGQALAVPRKSARVIREISWGLRESGADGRICGLLDAQVDAITGACDDFPVHGFRDGVLKALDHALAQIGELGEGKFPDPANAPASLAAARRKQQAAQTKSAPVADTALAHATPVAKAAEPLPTPAPARFPGANPVGGTFTASIDGHLGTTLGASQSLGASLLANGIVPKPAGPRPDPLAPIRRMSSAEKIAFFT
jgi:hypothetical protein